MSTEAKIKHTEQARLFREHMETQHTQFPRADLSLALGHIDSLLTELARNRRLLEAGEQLRRACERGVEALWVAVDVGVDLPGFRAEDPVVVKQMNSALAAYQEAAKS